MGQHAGGIDVDGVAARGLDDGNAVIGDVAAEVAGGDDAVVEVIGIEDLFETGGDGVKVAAGKSAVGRKAFGEDQEITLLLGDAVVAGTELGLNDRRDSSQPKVVKAAVITTARSNPCR